MPAIRSGWPCSDELWWLEGAPAKPKLAKFGSVQPMRHANTAIQRDIPAAVTALNVWDGKRIVYTSDYTPPFSKTICFEIARR